jgi:hypothetical protein
MCGGILRVLDEVVCPCDRHAVVHQHCADRHLALGEGRRSFFKRKLHPLLVS